MKPVEVHRKIVKNRFNFAPQFFNSPSVALLEKAPFKAPDGSDFLHGLEEKKRHSPFFGIPLLKRLSSTSQTSEHTTGKPLTTEPRALHAHDR
jgi:hypothetical protein